MKVYSLFKILTVGLSTRLYWHFRKLGTV